LVPGRISHADELPAEAYISGVVGHAQTYSLSCESRSAADLASFWGVAISEDEFLNALPRAKNPDEGFVGNVEDEWGYIPPYSYGVHADPVANVLVGYGFQAQALHDMSWEALKGEVAAGRPVIVWVIGQIWQGTPKSYTAPDGETATVAHFEHTMIVVGYGESLVHLVDAFSGAHVTHSVSNFLTSWAVLGNMAVTAQLPDHSARTNGTDTYVVQRGDYLAKLALEWEVSWQDLAALNGIVYPYVIHPGQELHKPVVGGTQETPTVPAATPASIDEEDIPESTPTPVVQATYVVQSGDHLMKIARALELDWQAIAELNGLSHPYLLYPGDVLLLPGDDDDADFAAPAKSTPQPPDLADIPETYTVERGDYLVAVAREFGLNWVSLASLNNIPSPYIVHPGQVLRLR